MPERPQGGRRFRRFQLKLKKDGTKKPLISGLPGLKVVKNVQKVIKMTIFSMARAKLGQSKAYFLKVWLYNCHDLAL